MKWGRGGGEGVRRLRRAKNKRRKVSKKKALQKKNQKFLRIWTTILLNLLKSKSHPF